MPILKGARARARDATLTTCVNTRRIIEEEDRGSRLDRSIVTRGKTRNCTVSHRTRRYRAHGMLLPNDPTFYRLTTTARWWVVVGFDRCPEAKTLSVDRCRDDGVEIPTRHSAHDRAAFAFVFLPIVARLLPLWRIGECQTREEGNARRRRRRRKKRERESRQVEEKEGERTGRSYLVPLRE